MSFMNKKRLCLAAFLTTFLTILGAQSDAQEKPAKDREGAQEQAQVLLALHQQHQNAVSMSAQGRLREAEAELRQILLTTDGRGKEVKEVALEELLYRARERERRECANDSQREPL